MHSEALLVITAAFAGFLLKSSLGSCICWGLSKVVPSPSGRFLVWLGFLAGAGCYWLWLAQGLAPHGPALGSHMLPAVLAQTAPVGKWQIQPSWAFPLLLVWRGLGVLYLIASGYFLLARMKKQMHLRWILRFAYRAPEEMENIFQPIAESLDTGKVRLLVLPGISSPATFGWIRPTILLPPLCLQQDWSDLEDIFRHELQHVRRRDFVFHTIASLCHALLFFHPAAWYARRRLKLESELACDLAVVNDSPERRATYAECLVRFARLNAVEGPKPWDLDFAGSSLQLKVRVRSVLAETRKNSGWLLGLRASLGVLLFACFLGIVPSLFIVLSYTQHEIVQPAVASPTLLASRPQVRPRKSGNFKVDLRERSVLTGRVFATPPPMVSTVAPAETAVDAAPIAPRESEQIFSAAPGPTLKRRSAEAGVAAPESAPATIIPLSSQPSSHSSDSIARRAATASAIAAGASEAISIASHGRDRDDH